MKEKYKYVGNISCIGERVYYLTIGNVYEFEMEGDDYGTTCSNNGEEVFEFFPNPSHGKWESVE